MSKVANSGQVVQRCHFKIVKSADSNYGNTLAYIVKINYLDMLGVLEGSLGVLWKKVRVLQEIFAVLYVKMDNLLLH